MHIAYLCADRGIPIGGTKGASIHVEAVVEALRARGHTVPLFAARVAESGLADTVDVGFDRTLKRVRRQLASMPRQALRAREVYSLLLNAPVGEALSALHRESPIDAVYERHSLWSTAGLRFARQHGLPFVLEVNAPLVKEQQTYRAVALPEVGRAIEHELTRAADLVVVPSYELAEIVRAGGRQRRVLVLPNGVDLGLFARPPKLEDPRAAVLDGCFVLAFVGSLKPWHGVGELLAAFRELAAEVPDVHLLVVGDGPMRPAVEEAAERLGPERMTFVGAAPHREVPAWLAHADLGLAPYPQLADFYFSPLKVVEYLAAGLPVVASRIGQCTELVREDCGLLVPPGEPRALAEAVESLHADPHRRRRMAAAGREHARRSHGWSGVARLLEEAIGKLTRAGSGDRRLARRRSA